MSRRPLNLSGLRILRQFIEGKMRNSIAATIAVACAWCSGIGAAAAADLPARTYTKAPPPLVAMYDWSGFYIGGDVGWAGSRLTGEVDAFPSPGFGAPAISGNGLAGFGLLPTNHGLKRDGVIAGLYAGYSWQVGQTIFGIEGDGSYLGRQGSSTQALFFTSGGAPALDGSKIQLTASDRWLASIRGRLGYAFNQVMVYGTGGAAFTEVRSNLNLLVPPNQTINGQFNLNDAPSSFTSFSQNKTGYAAGAGIEWMFAPNWIGRLEYLHYGFGGATGVLPIVHDSCFVETHCRFQAKLSDLNIDSVRVGISYKFGSPVVAKY
jgi:outer membrane immunogenic protein